MEFDNDRPIYLQILEDFKSKISSGEWKAGRRRDEISD